MEPRRRGRSIPAAGYEGRPTGGLGQEPCPGALTDVGARVDLILIKARRQLMMTGHARYPDQLECGGSAPHRGPRYEFRCATPLSALTLRGCRAAFIGIGSSPSVDGARPRRSIASSPCSTTVMLRRRKLLTNRGRLFEVSPVDGKARPGRICPQSVIARAATSLTLMPSAAIAVGYSTTLEDQVHEECQGVLTGDDRGSN